MPSFMGDPILEFGSSRFVAPLRLHFGGSKAANKIESLCLRQKMYHCASVSLITCLYVHTVSAQGFEYDDLYVTAHLELPECKCSP